MWKRACIFILQLLTRRHKEHSTRVSSFLFVAQLRVLKIQTKTSQRPAPTVASCIFQSELVDTKNQFGLKTRAQQEAVCDQNEGIWTSPFSGDAFLPK
jgi:hypothetical protein